MTRMASTCGRWTVLAGTLLLGACVSALEFVSGEPPRLFDLTPKSTFDPALPEVDARISIDIPTAAAGLNTTRIALKPTPTQFEYYARAQWVDVVPVMVQNLLVESFDNSGRIDVLERSAYGLRADYSLLTNIREFQAEYDGSGPPTVEVRLQVRMVRLPRRSTISAATITGSVPAASRKMQDIVTAFDQAFGKAAKRLVEWTVRQAAEARTG